MDHTFFTNILRLVKDQRLRFDMVTTLSILMNLYGSDYGLGPHNLRKIKKNRLCELTSKTLSGASGTSMVNIYKYIENISRYTTN